MKKAQKFSLILNAIFIIGSLILFVKFKDRVLARFKAPEKKKVAIAVYGDSRVQYGNWEEGLRRHDVYNAGIGGATTAQLLDSIERVIKLHPKICILQCGINDIRSKVAMGTTIKKYLALIDMLTRNNIIVVASSIIPVSKDPFQYDIPDQVINDKVDTLNMIIKSIARKKGIEFMDLNKELAENKRFKLQYTLDGVHVNPAGFDVWYNEVKAVLNKYHI